MTSARTPIEKFALEVSFVWEKYCITKKNNLKNKNLICTPYLFFLIFLKKIIKTRSVELVFIHIFYFYSLLKVLILNNYTSFNFI